MLQNITFQLYLSCDYLRRSAVSSPSCPWPTTATGAGWVTMVSPRRMRLTRVVRAMTTATTRWWPPETATCPTPSWSPTPGHPSKVTTPHWSVTTARKRGQYFFLVPSINNWRRLLSQDFKTDRVGGWEFVLLLPHLHVWLAVGDLSAEGW